MSDESTPQPDPRPPSETPAESPFTPPPLDLEKRDYGSDDYPRQSDDRD
jgi:hypothetical protein